MATVEQPKKATKRKPIPEHWEEWTKYLAKRAKPASLVKLISAKNAAPLSWALPADIRGTQTEDLIIRLRGLQARKTGDAGEIVAELEHWLESVRLREISATLAFESLTWCHALPALAKLLPAAPWSQLVEQLVSVATDAARSELGADPLSILLLAGELPLTLAYLLPELPSCKALDRPAREVLSHGLMELLDGEGMPHAHHFPVAGALLACWTRALYMGRTMKRNCFTKDAKTQYEWFVRQSLRLLRNNGTLAFSSDTLAVTSLFEAALMLVADDEDDEIANRMLVGSRSPVKSRSSLPTPATNSEWAEMAVLRREWDRSAEQLIVTYTNREVRMELNCASETVFSGGCHPELRVDGKLLEMEQDWEEVCWHSDEDLDYFEIEGRFENGWKVQRQFALARHDRFLIIADAVVGQAVADINHRFTLPVHNNISFTPADETREGILSGRKPLAAVLPLQLPEWRAERVEGSLSQTSEGLQLQQSAHGRCLMAPLFLDLKPKRFSRQLTWRQLTVAQQLQILPADVAVGYRIQTGKRQWVIYRSLAPTASRSVLGQHFSSEFVLARFPDDGELKQLIEIE